MRILIDEDIAHIARAMPMSMAGDSSTPVLPAAYWKKRLFALLDEAHLTRAQLLAIDSLLLRLDEFSRRQNLAAVHVGAADGHFEEGPACVSGEAAPRDLPARRPGTSIAR